MLLKSNQIKLIFLSILVNFFTICGLFAQDVQKPAYIEQNQKCFKCHGHKTYHFYNENIEREVKDRMNPYFVIDSATFYISNHRNLECTDCHSSEYANFPHSGELRMEPKLSCLDCHGGDESFAKFRFEEINEEFLKSVHSTKHDETFTCWMCHDPHRYKINARSDKNIKEVIAYDNSICLSCHINIDKYQLITDKVNPNIMETHSWLPNQALHFRNVRCIECHAEQNDSILVAHDILPKEYAVKKCVECHSSNSILMASLYKYQSQERRNSIGFLNAAILNTSYVIGANRNYYLNFLSILTFVLVLGAILVHTIFRIIKRK